MRLSISVLLVATTLVLAACGDDKSSQSTNGEDRRAPVATGPSAGPTGQDASGGQGQGASGAGNGNSTSPEDRARERRKRREAGRQLRRSLRPTRRGDFTGTSRTVYYEARSRCLAIPLRSLARAYAAGSERPDDVAQAYAKREAPTGSAHKAAVAGCLDGINTALRRGP